MLPDGGVGVCRRSGSESRYPALLRLALRDRSGRLVRWHELEEKPRGGGPLRIVRRLLLRLQLLLVRLTVMEGNREVVGGRDFARANLMGDFYHTCSSSLSCRSSAASTASKNSSSLIRLLGPSCGEQEREDSRVEGKTAAGSSDLLGYAAPL